MGKYLQEVFGTIHEVLGKKTRRKGGGQGQKETPEKNIAELLS
jgi:hypothetical protein